MSARLAGGDGALARLSREAQDAGLRAKAVAKMLTDALGTRAEQRACAEE